MNKMCKIKTCIVVNGQHFYLNDKVEVECHMPTGEIKTLKGRLSDIYIENINSWYSGRATTCTDFKLKAIILDMSKEYESQAEMIPTDRIISMKEIYN